MLPFLVLDHDQPSRQRVALRKRRLKAAGQMIENIADGRQFGEIERRQARRKVAGGEARKTRADRQRWPQCVCERRVNQHAKPDKRAGHDDGEAARLAPALCDEALAIDRRHRLAVRFLAETDRTRRLAARIENALVEIGEQPRRAGIVGRDAAAQPLNNFTAWRAIGDAEAGRHQRGRYSLQIRELNGCALDPANLALPANRRSGQVTIGAKEEGVAMRHLLVTVLAILLWLAPSCGKAEDGSNKTQRAAVAVIDFDYVDTSGEARDQRGEHEARLAVFMRALKDDLAQGDSFRLVTPTCAPAPCSLAGSTVSGLMAAAREVGGDILLIGGVHKMSTLVQWAKIEAIDPKTERVLFDRLFTFRGDTDEAWRRAEVFIVDEITAVSG